VSRLRAEIGRADLLSRIRRTGVEGIRVLRCPIIQLMGKPSLSWPVAGDEDGAICPEVPFPYALDKEAKVQTFVIASQPQAILIAGRGVADDLLIAIVVNGVGAEVDHAIAIEVFVFDIPRTKEEPAAFKNRLGGNAFFHHVFSII